MFNFQVLNEVSEETLILGFKSFFQNLVDSNIRICHLYNFNPNQEVDIVYEYNIKSCKENNQYEVYGYIHNDFILKKFKIITLVKHLCSSLKISIIIPTKIDYYTVILIDKDCDTHLAEIDGRNNIECIKIFSIKKDDSLYNLEDIV